jgi:ATP-dependent DNA helicase DinG
LIRKDIPFLQRATGINFLAVLVKGRSNYFCLRRGETAGAELGLFDQEQSAELQQILSWAAPLRRWLTRGSLLYPRLPDLG